MKIDVTAADIKAGRQNSCSSCPVALAVQRQCPGQKVHVNRIAVYIDNHPHPLPVEVRAIITRFDHTGKCEPYSFEIQPETLT